MRAGYGRMARNVAVGGRDLYDRQSIVEGGIGLARVVDEFDWAVPDARDRPRVADRNECREAE